MTTLLGVDPTATSTSLEHTLGTTYTDHKGREFVAVQATEVVTAGQMCIIHGDYTCEPITATLAAHDTGAGKLCGLALNAFADNAYGWLARRGTGADFLVNLVGVADDFQPLTSTSTAGSLDNFDAGSATAPYIAGIVITTASGGAEQEICILENPVLTTDYPA